MEKINDVMKGISKMIHITKDLMIVYKPNTADKYRPKFMNAAKPYEVIAEKTIKSKREDKEVEDLHFGFIADDYCLTFIAAFNCHVIVNDSTQTPLQDYYRFVNKAAKDQKNENPANV